MQTKHWKTKMRRDAKDKKWQDCKKQVYEMDKSQCLLCQCMTVAEAIQFKNSNPINTSRIDPAHYKAVSLRMDLMYDPQNVFCICREHHNRLDRNRNPITNELCTPEVTESFWQRIINKRKENLSTTDKDIKLIDFFFD